MKQALNNPILFWMTFIILFLSIAKFMSVGLFIMFILAVWVWKWLAKNLPD